MFRRFVDWLFEPVETDIGLFLGIVTLMVMATMVFGIYMAHIERQAELRCLRAGYPEVRVSGFIDPVYYCVRIQDGAHQVVRLDAIPECHCED